VVMLLTPFVDLFDLRKKIVAECLPAEPGLYGHHKHEVDEGEGAVAEDERVAMRSRFLYLGFLEGSTFIRRVVEKMSATLGG